MDRDRPSLRHPLSSIENQYELSLQYLQITKSYSFWQYLLTKTLSAPRGLAAWTLVLANKHRSTNMRVIIVDLDVMSYERFAFVDIMIYFQWNWAIRLQWRTEWEKGRLYIQQSSKKNGGEKGKRKEFVTVIACFVWPDPDAHDNILSFFINQVSINR